MVGSLDGLLSIPFVTENYFSTKLGEKPRKTLFPLLSEGSFTIVSDPNAPGIGMAPITTQEQTDE